jgi:hypothetical protein
LAASIEAMSASARFAGKDRSPARANRDGASHFDDDAPERREADLRFDTGTPLHSETGTSDGDSDVLTLMIG